MVKQKYVNVDLICLCLRRGRAVSLGRRDAYGVKNFKRLVSDRV